MLKNKPTAKQSNTLKKANWKVHFVTTPNGPLTLWLENNFL